jgi:copper resistance protein C
LAGTALWPLPASAHAIVVSASPTDGAALASGDTPLVLRFNSRIDHERSRLSPIAADAWVWPIAFVVVGYVLLIYREA